MLKSKMFEIRDVGTFIPVLCVKMKPEGVGGYLLRRAGFSKDSDSIQLVWISSGKTEYDPFKWGDRTMSPLTYTSWIIGTNWLMVRSLMWNISWKRETDRKFQRGIHDNES